MISAHIGPQKSDLRDQTVMVSETIGFFAQLSGSKNLVNFWIKKSLYSVVLRKN
jgi:hypothetical protein